MPFIHGSSLFCRRLSFNSTPAIKTRAGVIINYYRSIYIGIMDSATHMPHSCIIPEMATFPPATAKAMPPITVSIAYSAIKPDMRSPVTSVPPVMAIIKPPITGSPKKTYLRDNYPYARHPIISVRTPGPIAGCPHISISGAWRLFIYRQSGRGYSYAYSNTNLRICFDYSNQGGKNDEEYSKPFHSIMGI